MRCTTGAAQRATNTQGIAAQAHSTAALEWAMHSRKERRTNSIAMQTAPPATRELDRRNIFITSARDQLLSLILTPSLAKLKRSPAVLSRSLINTPCSFLSTATAPPPATVTPAEAMV